jgi:hypothetical protein
MGKKKRKEYTLDLEPEEVVINGTVYTVNVLMGDVTRIMGEDGNPDVFKMLEMSVRLDGEPLQDARKSLPFPVQQILVEAVNRVNGLDSSEDESGNA